jgi:hypothetical protein
MPLTHPTRNRPLRRASPPQPREVPAAGPRISQGDLARPLPRGRGGPAAATGGSGPVRAPPVPVRNRRPRVPVAGRGTAAPGTECRTQTPPPPPAAPRSVAGDGSSRPCRPCGASGVPSRPQEAPGLPPSRTKRGRWRSRRRRSGRVRVRSSSRRHRWWTRGVAAGSVVGADGKVEGGRNRNGLHREATRGGSDGQGSARNAEPRRGDRQDASSRA